MSASRTACAAVRAALWMLAACLPAGAVFAAKSPAQLALAAGSRVGVVSLLDAEVTHFHAARQVQGSFLKTYAVKWQASAMLVEAVREQLSKMALVAVPLAPGEALIRAREDCFLNANLAKSLSKECAAPYAQLGASEHLAAVIVLGPGLNNSAHAQGSRRKDLPEYLRGWCVVSSEGATNPPVLLNLTELLLIDTTPSAVVLVDREWGGVMTQPWIGFSAPADLKVLPEQQLEQLQPLYAAMIKQQSSALLGHLVIP
jgi:hypothetical protein